MANVRFMVEWSSKGVFLQVVHVYFYWQSAALFGFLRNLTCAFIRAWRFCLCPGGLLRLFFTLIFARPLLTNCRTHARLLVTGWFFDTWTPLLMLLEDTTLMTISFTLAKMINEWQSLQNDWTQHPVTHGQHGAAYILANHFVPMQSLANHSIRFSNTASLASLSIFHGTDPIYLQSISCLALVTSH